jgi:hypothetical protein
MSEAREFFEQWSRIWREHDGKGWPRLLVDGAVLRNPMGVVPRAHLPAYMASLVASMPDHKIEPIRWAETADGILIEWVMTGTLRGSSVEIRGADRFTLRGSQAVEGVAYFNPAPLLNSAPTASLDVERIARDYDAAWNRKDVDGIVALHTEDSSFRLHVAGAPSLRGRQALRNAFASSLANWREISFQLARLHIGERFYVWESNARGILARPLKLGSVTIEATGTPVSFTGVDIITLDRRGLIATKETFFDLIAVANAAASPRAPGRDQVGDSNVVS